MRRTLCFSWVVALLVLGTSVPAGAEPLADVRVEGVGIEWQASHPGMGLVLTVSGPGGFYLQQEYPAGASPSFSVFESDGGLRPAGNYAYELRPVPQIDAAGQAALQQAREQGGDAGPILKGAGMPAAEVQSGAFAIADGAIFMGGQAEPGAGKPAGGNRLVTKDQVIPDDLIVQGSICAGIDCVNNEDFGFDTIRLKENNTRIQFNDTSSTTGFPTNNWQIRANSSASGGQNFLAFVDQGATGQTETGTIVFGVESGATANSLWVDTGARVGIGTGTPVLNLHVNTSNTPALRLEQNSSGGFTAQTWDVAGNEANFFVRSVTTGSQLPFRIRPGAPSSSIDIAADGDVGVGTASPGASLHVARSDGTANLRVEETSGTELERTLLNLVNNGNNAFEVEDSSADGSSWQFKVSGPSFRVNKNGTGGDEMVIRDRNDGSGQATLVVNGSVQATNVTFSSSASLKTGFAPVDVREILTKVASLPLTEWQFLADSGGVRHLGPIAEDFHQAFGLGSSAGSISAIDAGGVTMAALQGLYLELQDRGQLFDQVLREKDLQISELRDEAEQLKRRHATLEDELRLLQDQVRSLAASPR